MSRLFRVTLVVCTVIGIPVLVYFTATNFLISPIGGLLGLIFAAVYVALVIWLFTLSPMWPDRAGAGWRWVAACLVWGAGVSFLLVMAGGLPVMDLVSKLGWDLFEASFGGAYPEEIAKALGVGVILFTFRGLNRPWHGLMTGALVGLGFEAIENAMYGAMFAVMDPNSDVAGTLSTWALRVFAGPGLHIVFSALAGWGLGLAVFSAGRTPAWRFRVAAVWLFIAFLLHFGWNIMWPQVWMQIAGAVTAAAVMYPLLAWVWVRAHRMCRADDTYAFTPVPTASVTAVRG